MAIAILVEKPSVHVDADGVIKVGQTRVTLDTVVAAFQEGATAEEIAQQYPSLPLADIYAAIGYYLHHCEEVAAYLQEREQKAEDVKQQNLAISTTQGLRERLLKRRVLQLQ